MNGESARPFPWRPYLSEFAGVALLLLVGLSTVILMFGDGSPIPRDDFGATCQAARDSAATPCTRTSVHRLVRASGARRTVSLHSRR